MPFHEVQLSACTAAPGAGFLAPNVECPESERPPSPMSVDNVETIENPSTHSTAGAAFSATPAVAFPTFYIETNYNMSLRQNKEPGYLGKGRERNRYRITQKERKKALLAEAPKSLEDLRDTVS